MLFARVRTAVVLLVVVLVVLFFAPVHAWLALALVLIGFSAWEWAGLAGMQRGCFRACYSFLACTLCVGFWIISGSGSPYRIGLYTGTVAFWVLGVPLLLVYREQLRGAVRTGFLGLGIFIPVYCAMGDLREAGSSLLLSIMAIVWISDSSAYFAGRRFGRRKLAPAVSPGKTWEGIWAAFIATSIFGAVWGGLYYDSIPIILGRGSPAPWEMALLAVAIASLGVLGDLVESLLKRNAGVKESGTLLPGHGGVLDRVDALLPVMPFAALVFSL